MKDYRKPILNRDEKKVAEIIRQACEVNNAELYSKIRIADTVDIVNSGIPDNLYSYCLKAHFDNIICQNNKIEFAIEYDGPGHSDANDAMKNQICEHFRIPLFRVTLSHLNSSVGGEKFLSFLVYQWFCYKWFSDEKKTGRIDYYEPFDLMFFNRVSGKDGFQPFWLAKTFFGKINKLMKEHLSDFDDGYKYGIAHMFVSHGAFASGFPNYQHWKGYAYIKVRNNEFVCSNVDLSLNAFGLDVDEAPHITQIATYITGMYISELYSNLKDFFDGNQSRVSSAETVKKLLGKWKEDGFHCIIGFNPP